MSMRSIEPKPTYYKGRRFRSKLESKAAQWLDKEGLRWIYEPETLKLGRLLYTPDFYLPDLDALIEVKPIIALSEFKRVEKLITRLKKPCLILSANDLGEIEMYRLWNYSGPCGNGTGIPDSWTWHDKGDFDFFEFEGRRWIAANICCTPIYKSQNHKCSCDR